MSYPDSVRYLYALGNELKAGAKFGLERMQVLLREIGHPEQGQRFLHVAGTNGKGSTCAMIASTLRASGLRTGLFISPHLIEPTERIQINREHISAEDFAAVFNVVHAAAERLMETNRIDAHPSYFETVTAMALVHLHGKCDISVIEVGLGGRLDATNVITPVLSVITAIDFDHEAFLGNTLELIAFEKAGILKPGVPVVVSPQLPEADAVITERAGELGCSITHTELSELSSVVPDRAGSRFIFDGVEYRCPLPGRHQLSNSLTAIKACLQLGIEPSAIQEGIAQTRWPGRLEFVSRRPDFILDGAHNPAGAKALATYIREFSSGRPVWIVYGAMRDKAIEEVTGQLFPLADHLILTAPNFDRALRPEAIAAAENHPSCEIAPTSTEAIHMATHAPENATVFFTGSLYLVGEVRAQLLATFDKR